MASSSKNALRLMAVALGALVLGGCASAEVDDGPQVLIRGRRGELRNTRNLSPEARARRRALAARSTDSANASRAATFAAPTPSDARAANGRLVGRSRGRGAVGFENRGARAPDNGRRLVDAPDRRGQQRGASLRFRRKGYEYDNTTCTIGPRYEFSGVDGPNEAEREEARRLRPPVKVELPEPGAKGGKGGKDKPKPQKPPEPIPVEDMLVSAGG